MGEEAAEALRAAWACWRARAAELLALVEEHATEPALN